MSHSPIVNRAEPIPNRSAMILMRTENVTATRPVRFVRALPRALRAGTWMAALAVLVTGAAAGTVIDTYDTAQGEITAPEPGPQSSSVNGAGILGGDRDLSIERLEGADNFVAAEVIGGVLEMADGSSRGQLTVTYDADSDPETLDPTGLGGVDLTDSGAATALRLVTTALAAPVDLTVTVYTDGTLVSMAARRMAAMGTEIIDFAQFRAVGSSGAASFDNVGAIVLTLTTSVLPAPPPPTSAPSTGEAATGEGAPEAKTVLPDVLIEVDIVDTVGPNLASATKDALDVTGTSDVDPAVPGQVLTYRIEVPNTGGVAEGVSFDDVIDANLTVVPDSLTTLPFGVDDLYEAVGNVQLSVDVANGVLANDRDVDDGATPQPLTVTAFDATSAGGGSVNVAANGSFTYTSAGGFEGVDSFVYTVTDNEGQTDTGTVTVTVADTIWFVENTVDPGGSGTFEDPFHTLAAAEAVAQLGDTIRVRRGDGTDTNHDAGIVLQARQRLIGAGVPLVVGGVEIEPADPMGAPTISHTDHVVNLANDVEVRGLAIDTNAAVAEHGIRGNFVTGTIEISDVVVTGNGNHGGILLTNSASANVNLTDVDLTAGDDPALQVSNVLSVSLTGACDFSSAGTVMDVVQTNLTGTVQTLVGAQARFAQLAAASNFAVTTSTTLTNPSGIGLRVMSSPNVSLAFGATSVTDNNIGAGASGTAVDLATGNAGATLGFASLAVVADGGTGLLSAAGTVDIAAATSTIAATGGPAIDAAGTAFATSGAAGATFASLTSTNSTGRGLRLANTTGTVTVSGTTMISGATTTGLDLSAAGAFATNVLSVGGATGFVATNSGAVSVANATGSQVASTAGPAITMQSTDIGAAGMRLTSVMAGTTGAAPGMLFDNVDNGQFFTESTTIAGTGAGQHGIVINGSAAGFTFNGTTAVDDTGGDGINLNGPNGAVSFNSVAIDDTGGNGVSVIANTGTVDINGGTIGETAGSGTTTAGNGVDIASGMANVTIAAAIRNTANRAVEVTGRAAGTVDISGAINDTALGINVANNTGGTTRFSNSSKVLNTGANQAVTLATNGGHTVSFTGGGLDIDTTTGRGFSAEGGGTVTMTRDAGPANSVTTTTGTAVRIANTTIGAAHLEWTRIDTTTAGTNTAIILDTTGAGEFRVTGTGTTAGSGGTISNKTVDAATLSNTGGLVHLRNMIFQDIGNMAGGNDTVSGHDAIHGEMVMGGLRLEGARISRISDMAVHGTALAGGGATTFSGLEILNSTLEDTNRYHVANIGDDNNEGMVRVRGLTGTVRVTGSTLRRGAELLDLNSTTSGTLSMTVQNNAFSDSFKGLASSTSAAGLACVNVKMEQGADSVIHIGDPLEANAALGNTFDDCATVAIGIRHFNENHNGDTDVIISRNTLTADLGFGGVGGNPFGFGNIPNNSILLRPQGTSASTFDAVVSNNSLTRSGLAEGRIGAITVFFDSAGGVTSGASQVRVSDNTITTPVAAPIEVLAERNTSAAVLLRNNNIVPGVVSLPDFGPSDLPGNSTQVNTREDGRLDVTIEDHFFPQQDIIFVEPGESFKARTIGGGVGADVLCISLTDNTSDRGYQLRRDAGTFNLHQGVSASTSPQAILQDNGNRGGLTGGVADPNKNPPDVGVIGTVSTTGTACTLPSGSVGDGSF